MVPVRSEPTQPELPSVSPIRLLPWEAKVPNASGPLVVAVFPATMVLPSGHRAVTSLSRPPPLLAAELPLTVQLVSVVVPPLVSRWYRPPPFTVAELPLTVQLVSVVVPP